jgi:hypothetical protein
MATVVYDQFSRCSGGGHTSCRVTFNGAVLGTFVYDTADVIAPISALTQTQREALALAIAKIHFASKTPAQVITETSAGPVTVTI